MSDTIPPDAVQLLTPREVDTKIHRLAWEILERNARVPFALAGIHKRGVPLAQRLAKVLETERPGIPVGKVDITLHRDDPANLQAIGDMRNTELSFDIDGTHIILVDDVLFTGRTVRAAIDTLFEYGRPSRVSLAVFADRGKENRELPLQADYRGLDHHTAPGEYLRLLLREEDGQDGLFLVSRSGD